MIERPEPTRPDGPPSPLEELYRRLFVSSPQATFVFDAETLGFLAVNESALRQYGYSRDELLALSLPALWPVEDEPLDRQIVAKLPLQGRVTDVRASLGAHGYHRHRRKDGSILFVEPSVQRIDFLGREAWLSTVQDVTEHVVAQEALRDARTRLEAALEAGAIGTWVWNVQADRMHADRNLARMFSLSPEEAASAPLASYVRAIHPEDWPKVSAAIDQALAACGQYEADYRLLRPDGSVRSVVARGRVECDEAGRALRLPGVVVDVTERREAEARLARLAAESEHWRRVYETALSNTADFNYVFDLDGRFTYVNRALLALWQKELPEALGKNFFDLDYPPELAARLQQQIQEVIDTRQPLRDETPYTSGFGTRAYEYIFVPVLAPDGTVAAVAGSTRDITDRKRMEETLRSQAEQLREADRRKDEFLATLAHELRNPLAPIRNGLEILRLREPDAPAIQLVRELMDRQVQHLVRLVDDLLEVSRITRGQIELRKERFDLSSAVHSAVETSRPLIEAAGHELVLSLPLEPLYVEADLIRLAQVLANLLNNAAKYTDQGGRITLTATRDGQDALVRVRDNGMGIPADKLSHIFEMFAQIGRSHQRSQGGLGIGLALVNSLVRMHGGSVQAHSEGPGHGSELVVRIPLASDTAARTQSATPVAQSSAP
jgi:PAS domain S-box-containing protein